MGIRQSACAWVAGLLTGLMLLMGTCDAADIIKDGKAHGAIWHSGDQTQAAADLAENLRKMSDAQIEVKIPPAGEKPPAGAPAIVLGSLALEMGLSPPPKTVSLDGYSIQTKGQHLLMAGQSAASTGFAVTHYLETLGCRWFMENQWGVVIPDLKTVSVDGLDVSEKPDFLYREVWGTGRPRSRLGGMDMPNRHDWEHAPPDTYFADHPEFYALRGGQRRPGGWACTTRPEVQRIFADAYVAKARTGVKADTISPPDGRGFCECARCSALDVPDYIEPSSGTISMSDRYARFFDAVGSLVARQAPEFILSFYCYSDYTLPPKTVSKVSDNLVGWVTTIRFCRLHGVNNPRCESRQRYQQVVEGWTKLMRTACYDYNYNLAEVTVPISKISYLRDNIPFLKKSGCLGVNMESFPAYSLYGPHTYLTTKLLWDADADVDAILDDYYSKLCGKAAPHVKAYWQRIDKAAREADVHCGSFYGLHAIWTPELVRQSEADLDAATGAADSDLIRERVALFRSGLDSAKHYLAVREAVNRCDFAKAKEVFDKWLLLLDDAAAKNYMTRKEYRRGYAERFLLPMIASGLTRTTGECKLVAQLPDEWDFRYDPQNVGEKEGYFGREVPAEGWQRVKTYSATLNEQKIPEQLTWMWYRTSFAVPKHLPAGPLHLWFGEVDGSPTKVYLNGELAGEFSGTRRPNEVEVTCKRRGLSVFAPRLGRSRKLAKLLPGKENLIVVKTGHMGISELMLGGILRPVMLYSGKIPSVGADRKP
jgi:hypothetical protein